MEDMLHSKTDKAASPVEDEDDDSLTDDDMKKLVEYDYVRFNFTDLNGISRCRIVPKRHLAKHLRDGVDVFSGLITIGFNGEIQPIKELEDVGYGNGLLKPVGGTVQALTWATAGKFKVGEVLCETFWAKPERLISRQAACPRYVARLQLKRLEKLGYKFMSSYEAEFHLFKQNTTEVATSKTQWSSINGTQALSVVEGFLYHLDQCLISGGVDVSLINAEYSPGQFEFALNTRFAIEAPDMMSRFKNWVKEISLQENLNATFMTKIDSTNGNGLHYNHSLWTLSDHKNAFYDAAAPDKLSDTAKHWIAGLLHHTKAIIALCSPTVNCYRRYFQPWAPDRINWGMDDRATMVRAKSTNPSKTYLENRLPSGSANPYLVLAATVAAGVSGIVSKLECPPTRTNKEEFLPKSFGEALEELEKDNLMVEALGEEFIRWFVQIKRENEVKKLPKDDLEIERKMYISAL